jgi:hypothetical protein
MTFHAAPHCPRPGASVQAIDAAYRALTASRAGGAALTRWHATGDLADADTLDSVVAAVAHPDRQPRSDRYTAALVRAYQTGDADAAIVLAKALLGGIRHRAGPRAGADDDLCAELGLVVAGIDPTLPNLYWRILGRLRKRASAAHHRDRRYLTPLPTTVRAIHAFAGDLPYAADDPTGDHAVAAVAHTHLARLIAAALADGRLDADRWALFVAHRLGGRPYDTSRLASVGRTRVYRVGCTLQRLLSDGGLLDVCA